MRHRVAGRRLGRTSEHRLALRRNLVASLFEHETVSTTMEKAKEVKSFAEKLITLAKKGTLAARRRAIAQLGNRDIVENEDGKTVKKGTVIGKLFSELGPRYLDRSGGYTRIIRLSLRRLGDNGQLVLLQLVGEDEVQTTKHRKAKAEEVTTIETEQAVEAEATDQTENVDEPETEKNQDESQAVNAENEANQDEDTDQQ
ncbi:MAG: 50S ribosomal protein L17 [Planctomycetota bacterium]|jgi:large subunit ribosomal protein L17